MNKYTELSDFEINKKVFIQLYGKESLKDKDMRGVFSRVDYCNNPADAMPIIIENKITMAFDIRNNIWYAHSGSTMDDCGWGYEFEPSLFAYRYNYYRAAMEVFLMMKDGENNND